MSVYISRRLRQLVIRRADNLCEYCLYGDEETFVGFQIEHIISVKHKGKTTAENLAYTCVFCNRFKGSDVASYSGTGELTRLFNPRTDKWFEHFRLEEGRIIGISEIGDVSASLLGFNRPKRVFERAALIEAGRYPSIAALTRMLG